MLDLDEASASTATRSADAIMEYVRDCGLRVDWVLDTHPHADHFSAVAYIAEVAGAPSGIGRDVTAVQALWKRIYDFSTAS